jgi:hypothetical protein
MRDDEVERVTGELDAPDEPFLITVAGVTVTERGKRAITGDADLTDQQRAILTWLLRLQGAAGNER